MLKLILPLSLLATLPACAQWKASARINPSTVAVYPGGVGRHVDRLGSSTAPGGRAPCPLTAGLSDSKRGAINLDCFEFPEDSGEGPITPAYDRAVPGLLQSAQGAAVARNRLSAVLIKHADDVCVLEKGRLVATESSANFILSFLTQAFSGASTIVTGERTKSILSGVATLASGTQDNVNATFYRNQLVQAINKSIDKERERILTQIIASRAQGWEEYNVDDMIRLVNSYHQACSFEHGLQVLLDAAVDGSGAAAVLESRSRDRAILELENHVKFLKGQIDGAEEPRKAELQKQLKEAEAQLHGLRMARAQKLIVNPNAGDTSEKHEENSEGETSQGDAAKDKKES